MNDIEYLLMLALKLDYADLKADHKRLEETNKAKHHLILSLQMDNNAINYSLKRAEELAQGRRELLDYDDKRILELSTENTRLKEQCARLEQEYIRMFNQLYKED